MPRRNDDDVEVMIATIIERMNGIEYKIDSLKVDLAEIKSTAVSKDEFSPVRMLTYGAVGLIVSGLVGAVISYFIRKD
jgi:hypothetical protein